MEMAKPGLMSKPRCVIKWAHNLAHKNVLNMQLKQLMQCMRCEFSPGNLVLVDFKRVGPPYSTTLTR